MRIKNNKPTEIVVNAQEASQILSIDREPKLPGLWCNYQSISLFKWTENNTKQPGKILQSMYECSISLVVEISAEHMLSFFSSFIFQMYACWRGPNQRTRWATRICLYHEWLLWPGCCPVYLTCRWPRTLQALASKFCLPSISKCCSFLNYVVVWGLSWLYVVQPTYLCATFRLSIFPLSSPC